MLRNRRALLLSALCVAGALLGVAIIGGAQDATKKVQPVANAKPLTSKLLKALTEPIETDVFKGANVKLQELIGFVHEHMDKKGMEIPILVDFEAFKEDNPDTFKEESDLTDLPIRIPTLQKRLPLETILRIAISQIPNTKAALLVRKGMVEITTETRAAPFALMQTGVNIVFDRYPLWSAIDELAEKTGATIVLDPRIGTKSDTQVTANFVNGVDLRTAVSLLADMTGLKIVELQGLLYVTTPENAETLRKELKVRQEEELWRKSKHLPEANPPPPPRDAEAAWQPPAASPFLRSDKQAYCG